MTNTKTENIAATVDQIHRLTERGCEIIRCAVPTLEAAQALKEIRKQIAIPLVADIHFDYRLALEALRSGVDALRLNPGNIGGRDRVEKVVAAARERQVPIRIGVNAGSLPRDLLEKYGHPVRKLWWKPPGAIFIFWKRWIIIISSFLSRPTMCP